MILCDNSYGSLRWGKELLMKEYLHNYEVKRKHLVFFLVLKLGMQWEICSEKCFGSTEHSRKDSASSLESPEPFLILSKGDY